MTRLLTRFFFNIDNMTFSTIYMASVNGIQMHYVIGGYGDPVLLLHRCQENWYGWYKVMHPLAKNYTIIASDLRGIGDPSNLLVNMMIRP
jgi:pimeloyl-ACP methyl ester carboxylesterase